MPCFLMTFLFGKVMKYLGRDKAMIRQTIEEMVNSLSKAELLALAENLDHKVLTSALKKALEAMLWNSAK